MANAVRANIVGDLRMVKLARGWLMPAFERMYAVATGANGVPWSYICFFGIGNSMN
ncbi:hypothetical protein GCM10007362_17090 [Saccharibacillus endophyticus]|uniref:Uncharacterized protein n=1 Tax=Saccharibacillus endophyticus TaxID=2060666 RepID=A0ABQ1ZQM0_9BACL|nr:hypothetical protein GCM10007362_17090 [Saccharibacillus endophyticus]